MNILIVFIFISIFSLNQSTERVECRWSGQYLCGDKCVELDHGCFCGGQHFNFSESLAYTCCNEGPCFEDDFQDVHCNGIKIPYNDKCNDTCSQLSKFGYTLLECKNEDQCYIGIAACKGIAKCDL